MNKERIYILSTGRTGTTFLHTFLAKYYPEFNITHQTRWSRVINILGNLPIGKKGRISILNFSFNILKKQKVPVTTLDPLLSFPICEILSNELHNDAKVIHLVRNPFTFATSFNNWKNSSLSKIVLHYLIPFWQPVGYFHGIGFFQWIGMSKFEKYCWIWNFKNEKFQKLEEGYNYKRVSMESLTSSNAQNSLNELINFIGLPEKEINFDKISSKKVNVSSQKMQDHKEKEIMRQHCIKHCGSLAKQLGYTL